MNRINTKCQTIKLLIIIEEISFKFELNYYFVIIWLKNSLYYQTLNFFYQLLIQMN
jgi:hypothetical protein